MKYPKDQLGNRGMVRGRSVTPPASNPFYSCLSGQIFKDDENVFPSTSDICFIQWRVIRRCFGSDLDLDPHGSLSVWLVWSLTWTHPAAMKLPINVKWKPLAGSGTAIWWKLDPDPRIHYTVCTVAFCHQLLYCWTAGNLGLLLLVTTSMYKKQPWTFTIEC